MFNCTVLFMQYSRTVAPHSSKGPALIALMRLNQWAKITILSSTEEVYWQSGLSLRNQLEAAGITVCGERWSFMGGGGGGWTQVVVDGDVWWCTGGSPVAFEPGKLNNMTLGNIRLSGFRIVFVLAFDADSYAVASLGRQLSMMSGYAWLFPRKVPRSPDLQGFLWFRPFLSEGIDTFARQVSDYTKSHFNLTVSPDLVDVTYSAALHNAIMLYAHAATAMILEGKDLSNGEAVTTAVRRTSFEGAGGSIVTLDAHGDPVESYEVINYVVEEDGEMVSVPVGVYSCKTRRYTASQTQVVWPGHGQNATQVPFDSASGRQQKAERGCYKLRSSKECCTHYDGRPNWASDCVPGEL